MHLDGHHTTYLPSPVLRSSSTIRQLLFPSKRGLVPTYLPHFLDKCETCTHPCRLVDPLVIRAAGSLGLKLHMNMLIVVKIETFVLYPSCMAEHFAYAFT